MNAQEWWEVWHPSIKRTRTGWFYSIINDVPFIASSVELLQEIAYKHFAEPIEEAVWDAHLLGRFEMYAEENGFYWYPVGNAAVLVGPFDTLTDLFLSIANALTD